jgi:hypothetical protein
MEVWHSGEYTRKEMIDQQRIYSLGCWDERCPHTEFEGTSTSNGDVFKIACTIYYLSQFMNKLRIR